MQAFANLIISRLDFDVEVTTFDKVTSTRRPKPETLPSAARGSRRWDAERKRILDEKAAGSCPMPRNAGGLFVIDIWPAPKTNKLGPTFGLKGLETMPLEIFDAAIDIMQGIPELEPVILTAMFWPEKPNLAAPDKNQQVHAFRFSKVGVQCLDRVNHRVCARTLITLK